MPQQPEKFNEAKFQRWYASQAEQWDLNPNPDDPSQFYDYRAAYLAGAKPNASGHWPSQFKKAGHPNEIVGGFNTRTGDRMPGFPRATFGNLIDLGWAPETAQRLDAMPEPQFAPMASHRPGVTVAQLVALGDLLKRR